MRLVPHLISSLLLALVVAGGGCGAPSLVSSCSNGIHDGSETDVDCGGACKACAANQRCLVAGDCATGACVGNICVAAKLSSCGNRVKDGSETDVDCGGGACSPCAIGSHCAVSADCAGGACLNNVCAVANGCNDRVQDGAETDLDCGGGSCPRCALGRRCQLPGDCTGGACVNNVCAAASSCSNLVRDGNETDIDCGGSCAPCAVGRACVVNGDCASGSCSAGNHCVQPVVTPVPAVGVYGIRAGATAPLVVPGTQAGFAVSALGDGSFRIVWTGDGFVSGQYHQFDGSVYTDGSISATPGCSDQSCSLLAGDFLSLSYNAGGGSRIDFSSFDPTGLEGFEVFVSGGASNGQTVYLELYVDGEPVPGAIFFVAAGGLPSSPLTVPFGLTAQ
jgi:hypothetical protein